jgi:hypothetical protein
VDLKDEDDEIRQKVKEIKRDKDCDKIIEELERENKRLTREKHDAESERYRYKTAYEMLVKQLKK